MRAGPKAMRHMHCLCTNDTGTRKLPVSTIGEAKRPLCFREDGKECPLSHFSQKQAWMNQHVYARWWNTVARPGVCERQRGDTCALVMANSSTHDVAVEVNEVEALFLHLNVTAAHQPMDAGVVLRPLTRLGRARLSLPQKGRAKSPSLDPPFLGDDWRIMR